MGVWLIIRPANSHYFPVRFEVIRFNIVLVLLSALTAALHTSQGFVLFEIGRHELNGKPSLVCHGGKI